ncbi:ergot alkaloid biosynthesis protein [Agarivorans sp. QJM3NY_25]|uniref:ergot alkaloid biosynthesis protein n=1 Tax=Agarivorans sp. QJM3NY_25 TaxID=3421430 RepID=UPI003D7F15CC
MATNVLVLGGKGKTGRYVVEKLTNLGVSHRIATRSPQQPNEVAFDWMQAELATAAFKDTRALYIVAPTNSSEHGTLMLPILEQAIVQGVQRFVLLSASSLQAGGPMMGEVHAWLIKHAPEWAVLRPTWFMQNFSEQQHLPTICDEQAIYSATGMGRVGFIDAQDIAEVAVAALVAETAWNNDFILTGPDAMTYGDVANTLNEALDYPVSHINLTSAQLVERFQQQGMDQNYAQIMASMDAAIARGSEDKVTDNVETLTGRKPTCFADFVAREIQRWQSLAVKSDG